MGNSSANMKLRGSLSISLWAVAYINFAASLIALPVAFLFGKFDRTQLKLLFIMGLGMGAANVFYFAGIILSDVIRVIFLVERACLHFYLRLQAFGFC